MKNKITLINIFIIYFVLLIFEVSWNRILVLKIGSTSEANAIVLAAIMAGLGFGALYFGRFKNYESLNKLFNKILTFFIIVSFISFIILNYFFSFTLNMLDLISENYLLKRYFSYLISSIIIFIPSFFAGGIFPVISGIYVKSKENIIGKFSNVYVIETLGSAIGALLTGFVFLKYLGQLRTYLMAIILLIILLIINIILNRNYSKNRDNQITKIENINEITNPIYAKIILMLSFLFGFASMSIETIILRVASINLANVSYAFSIVTFIVIIGYTIGSFLAGLRQTKINDFNINKLYLKLMFMALVLLGILIYLTANVAEFIILPLHFALENNILRLLLPSISLSIVTLLPFSILTGYIFVMNISYYNLCSNKTVKLSSGKIYFINTLGTTLGPILTVFILIPLLGVIKTLILIGLLFSIFTLFLFLTKKHLTFKMNIIILSIVSVIFGLLLNFTPIIKILPPSFYLENKDIDFYQETKEGTIVVGASQNHFRKTYINNSQVIGGSYDAIKAVKFLGHIPFFTGIKNPQKALVVGFGIGVTASTILMHKEIKKLDCVELASNLIKAAFYYRKFNKGFYRSDRFVLHEGDGRNYIELSKEKYDIISSDPTHPILGSSNLYTKEYFKLCHDHLTDDGVITQYLPLHKLTTDAFWDIVSTFNSEFKNMYLWLGHTHAILIGFKDENKKYLDFNILQKETAKIRDEFLYSNPYSIASNLLLTSKELKLINKGRYNCDDKSFTEFFNFDSYNSKNWVENMKLIKKYRINPLKYFINVPDTTLFNKFYNNNNSLIEALIYSAQGNKQKYYQTLIEAYKNNPKNQEFLFLIRLFQKQNKR